jgi:hypothetical protein
MKTTNFETRVCEILQAMRPEGWLSAYAYERAVRQAKRLAQTEGK